MQLSNEQIAATAIGENLVVNAGAGTGKTTVLTARYLRLLEEGGLSPGQIVAITFTKKAAREIRERVDGALAALAQGDGCWKEAREQLVAAPISTIHSFYARVLRAYPLEAGIKPSFRVLEEIETGLMLDKAVAETFRQASQERCPHLALLVEVLGADALEGGGSLPSQIRQLYQALRNRGLLPAGASMSQYYKALPSWRHCLEALTDLAATEGSLRSVLGGKDKPEMLRAREAILAAANELAAARDPGALVALYPSLLALTELKGGRTAGHKEFIKAAVLGVQNILSQGLAPVLGEAVLSLLGRVDAVFTQHKDQAKGLDFSDLQFAMWRLLQLPSVAAALKKKYFTYMIDEFQDTDLLQHRIITALVEEDGVIPAGKLFVVGDEKQSIFRFRGAQVTVFQELRQKLVAADPRAERRITCNFRSRGPLLELVNALFPKLLEQGAGMEYIPLSHQRPGQDPGAELLICSRESGSPAAGEAAAMAARIKQMVGQRELLVGDSHAPQPVHYGDIAILLRSRTHLKEYEHHLRLAAIPYTVIGGIGFFQQPEVTDLLNLLRAVRNNLDELSLVAALRSPLFALEDDSLYALARSKEREGGNLLDHDSALSGEQRRRLLRAQSVLGQLRSAWGRLEFPALLDLAFTLTQYREAVLAGYGGLQRFANLEKLSDLAESFAAASPEEDFLDWCQRAADWDEGEALVDSEESDSVRIMTIHASKGLQFPVVFLPLANAKMGSGPKRLLLDPEGGLALNFPWRCPVWEKVKEQEAQQELGEYIRLLYVAMTRARDRLVFLGSIVKKEEQSSDFWIGALAQEAPQLIITKEGAPGESDLQSLQPLPTTGPPTALPPDMAATLAPLDRGPGQERYFSISQFLFWKRDPLQFDRQYLWGQAETELLPEGTQAREHEPGGAAFGSLLHRLLETVGEGALLPGQWEDLVPFYFPAASPAERRKIAQSVRTLLEAYIQDPGPPGIYCRADREQEFYYRLDKALFYGVIDKLLFADDHLAVVDYKSNIIPPEGPGPLVETYGCQLRFYALAAREIYRQPVKAYLQLLRLPPGRQVIEIDLSPAKQAETLAELREFIDYCFCWGKKRLSE